jgi:hypothetical protein
MYLALVGTCQQGAGPAALSLALNTTETTITVDISSVPPDQSANIDTNAGEADSTATASGGDGSYSYAWTITETADNNEGAAGCAVLANGTQNAARYSTATFRVTQPALISGGAPVEPPPRFQEATYRLRCTVTDGNSDTATADYTVTIQGQ